MNRELVLKLNEIREELEMPITDFIDILAKAEKRRDNSPLNITDEMLYEIILTTLQEYDYDLTDEEIYNSRKSNEQLIERAMKSLGLLK